MVSARLPMPTVKARLQHVRQMTGIKVKSHLAKWVKAGSPQAVNQAEFRDSLSRELAIKISRTTGASLDWLLTDTGAPFPSGPVPFPGAVPDSAEDRLRAAEDQLDATQTVLAAILRIVGAKLPTVAPDLEAELRRLPVETDSQRSVIEGAAVAVEAGRAQMAQVTRPVAPAGSHGKPQRKDR